MVTARRSKCQCRMQFFHLDSSLARGGQGVRDGIVSGYAYETTPNVPVIAGESTPTDAANSLDPELAPQAPQPGTLGHLALGAAGLAAWRREEEIGAK